jgi:hypothetical protein
MAIQYGNIFRYIIYKYYNGELIGLLKQLHC